MDRCDADAAITTIRPIALNRDLPVTFKYALRDQREAPWYATWGIVMADHMFHGASTAVSSCFTCPQHPVDKDTDTNDSDTDDENSDEDDDDDAASSMDDGADTETPQHTSPPRTPPRTSRPSRPAPLLSFSSESSGGCIVPYGNSDDPADWTQPRFPARRGPQPSLAAWDQPSPTRIHGRYADGSAQGRMAPINDRRAQYDGRPDTSLAAPFMNDPRRDPPLVSQMIVDVQPRQSGGMAPVTSPPHRERSLRSTRIPDFVQMLHSITTKPSAKAGVPPDITIMESRIILIVEIKRLPKGFRGQAFFGSVDVLEQLNEQAHHVLQSHLAPRQKLGGIFAFGYFWSYREFSKAELTPSPAKSERVDPSYDPNEWDHTRTPEDVTRGALPPFLKPIFGRARFLSIFDPKSDEALRLIRDRLRTFNQDIWPQS
ncbi:hypothetical protein JAAARDRAFT_624508 [Jaapia argillacea MUCL 33604]|uniref:Uncharacterized protein n=1 Tax=Jaapia argillacea MUCL 33604 TaxID=933084 RepID=A0A067Q7S8_9AGAM|nr:hypothetical protein JAAARDRAFT_624508 [Jaapia argillacea MUCL 33604]